MEPVTHRDRRGNVWRFGINCTREQRETIRRALAGVRNMGNRDALTLSRLLADADNPDGNPAVFADVEAAMLRGLAERFPVRVCRGLKLEPPEQEPAPWNAATAADESPGPYWWEDI